MLAPITAALLTSSVAMGAPPADPDAARAAMVAEHLKARDITDPRVLKAMATVERHRFVPEPYTAQAYADHPLPIGHDQTISQPYVVAWMSQLADVQPGDTVLEVGTGSGYQAAVLAQMGVEVYTIEIVEPLAKRTRKLFSELGLDETVHTRIGDGYRGWPEAAPFDAILVTAAPPEVPEPLKEQLKVGGHLVLPVGPEGGLQQLVRITKTEDGFEREPGVPVRFVPMTGEAQKTEEER